MIHYAHTFWATLSHINTQKFFSHDPRDPVTASSHQKSL